MLAFGHTKRKPTPYRHAPTLLSCPRPQPRKDLRAHVNRRGTVARVPLVLQVEPLPKRRGVLTIQRAQRSTLQPVERCRRRDSHAKPNRLRALLNGISWHGRPVVSPGAWRRRSEALPNLAL